MGCITTQLYCAWCKKVPVGSNHCCDPFDHEILCPGCRKHLSDAGLAHDQSWLEKVPEPEVKKEAT